MAKKVLIVDDDPAIVELLKFTLEGAGYKTLIAVDGDEAMKTIKEKRPDLVLLDIMLPTKDGYSVLEEIRGGAEFKILPIVIISAKVQEVDISFGLELGANDYFTKPLDLDKLVNKVERLLVKKV
jgi:DNA-binding response OmpR family regulator